MLFYKQSKLQQNGKKCFSFCYGVSPFFLFVFYSQGKLNFYHHVHTRQIKEFSLGRVVLILLLCYGEVKPTLCL